MNAITNNTHRSRFPLIFELMVWLIYVCLYKYSYFLDAANPVNPQHDNFPMPQLIIYAICMTLYTIPFYRYIAPRLLEKKKYVWLLLSTIAYFGIVLKYNNYIITWLFNQLSFEGELGKFYLNQHSIAVRKFRYLLGWDPNTLLTDLLAFMSVAFMRYAFENEKKKYMLERDNLMLQLESLKAQLHPHFLFNTLNSIYGMSITGNKETPQYILRLSEMMRYILYDCKQNFVPLEKDLNFIRNYIAMEQARYPEADIVFTVKGQAGNNQIAPLLFIQFIENSFKHGAHRVTDNGYIHGSLEISDGRIHFRLVNDVLSAQYQHSAILHLPADQLQHSGGTGFKAPVEQAEKEETYGGIGIQNVEKRLELFYPKRHKLQIRKEKDRYEVTVDIILSTPI